jgi:hypothetical protein
LTNVVEGSILKVGQVAGANISPQPEKGKTMAGIMDDMELSQALRAIKDKYNVVIGVWTREDAVNAILINKGLEDDDEGVAEAERMADIIWTSDFRHGLDEVANDPNEFFQDMVRMELQTHGLD